MYKRSSILDAVTCFPSCPENGEEFVENVIFNVGSSMCKIGNASSLPISQTVSPTLISGKPAIATISPACADSISTRFNPKNPNNFVIRNCCVDPSKRQIETIWLTLIVPRTIRPIPIRPT